jgi:hypothetical protein
VGTDGRNSFFSRPPDISPLASAGLGMVLVLWGLAIRGSFGGAIAGGGIGCILLALWDAFRILYLAPSPPPHWPQLSDDH